MESTRNWFIYFATVSANLMSFVVGWSYAWASPMIPKLNGNVDPDLNPLFQPTTMIEDSWIIALVNLGATLGTILSGPAADWIGRKRTLLIFALPMIASNLIMTFARTVTYFYIARILIGLGNGCSFTVLPMYIAEIAEPKSRGFLGCFMCVSQCLGVLTCFVLAPYTTVQSSNLVSVIPLCLYLITFACFVPESPYYLLLKNRQNEAEHNLKKFRSKNDVQKELLEIKNNVEDFIANKGSILDLFVSKTCRKSLIITVSLMFFQQFAGIIALLSNLQTIFQSTGSTIPPESSTIIIGTIQLFTVIVTSQLIDRLGRKILLLISVVGDVLSLSALGLYFYLQINKFDVDSISWLPIVSVIVFFVSFNLGMGPIPWMIMGELFPANVKSFASMITSATCLFLSFLVAYLFPTVSIVLGMAYSFWLFAGVSAFSLFVIALFVPETKGKSLQEIQKMLVARNK